MAVKVKLDEMMSKRETNCGELAKQIGIPAPDLSLLKSGKARAIKFTTLEKICTALDCEVSDILVFEKDRKSVV